MKTKDLSIILLILAAAAFGYGKYRHSLGPKSTKEACERGDAVSCRMQGGIEKKAGNYEEAKRYYQLACDAKDSTACYMKKGVETEEREKEMAKPESYSSASSAPATATPTPGCATSEAGCSATAPTH